MGKVHRVKKDFHRLLAHPLKEGDHCLGGDLATVYVGRVLRTGNFFLMYNSWGHAYKPLVEHLIRKHKAGVAHSDKTHPNV